MNYLNFSIFYIMNFNLLFLVFYTTKIILKESFLNTLTVGKKYKFELVYTNSSENYSNSSWPIHELKICNKNYL